MDQSIKETRKTAKEIAKSVDPSTLPDLHTGRASVEQKVTAAAAYIMEGGNARKAAKIANVHHNSVLTWKREDWWNHLVQWLRKDFAEDFKARLWQTAGKAVDVIDDRLENGDKILNYKTGEFEYKPIQGKDAATIFGILNDKLRVMEGQPTSIFENKSEDERLKQLKEKFEEFARFNNAKTIEHENG